MFCLKTDATEAHPGKRGKPMNNTLREITTNKAQKHYKYYRCVTNIHTRMARAGRRHIPKTLGKCVGFIFLLLLLPPQMTPCV